MPFEEIMAIPLDKMKEMVEARTGKPQAADFHPNLLTKEECDNLLDEALK